MDKLEYFCHCSLHSGCNQKLSLVRSVGDRDILLVLVEISMHIGSWVFLNTKQVHIYDQVA